MKTTFIKHPAAHDGFYFAEYASPVGTLIASGTDDALAGIYVRKSVKEFLEEAADRYGSAPRRSTVRFSTLFAELDEYFAGNPVEFSATLAPAGSAYELKVWKALCRIPRGRTLSYKDVAVKTGSPKAARAVGNACSKNPIPIVIPCHRVLASNGGIGGYTGGLEVKKHLLKLETPMR